MYNLTLLIVSGIILLLWVQRSDALSAYYVFIVLLTYLFYSDYLIRGDDCDVIANIPESLRIRYQISFLLVYLLCVLASLVSSTSKVESTLPSAKLTNSSAPLVIASCLWLGDISKRLFMSDWDVGLTLTNMLSARGDNPWSGGSAIGLGNDTFIFTVIALFLPIAAMLFGRVAVHMTARPLRRWLACLGFIACLLVLFCDGSRTMLALPLLYLLIEVALKHKSVPKRLLAVCGAGVIVVISFSAMYLFRSDGLMTVIQGQNTRPFEVTYHQDDSYYWAIHAADVAESTEYRMDPMLFVEAILVNPVPRYFWPTKPALLQEYYKSYKPYYVTTMYVGELIGMFGWVVGCAVSVPIALSVLLLLYKARGLVRYEYGVMLYCTISLYAYMCLRSLLNISIFSYFVVAALLVNGCLKRLSGKSDLNKGIAR